MQYILEQYSFTNYFIINGLAIVCWFYASLIPEHLCWDAQICYLSEHVETQYHLGICIV